MPSEQNGCSSKLFASASVTGLKDGFFKPPFLKLNLTTILNPPFEQAGLFKIQLLNNLSVIPNSTASRHHLESAIFNRQYF